MENFDLNSRTFPYQNTYFGFYMTWALQALGGFNYLALFGVVLSAEIGLCKFISTCAEDFTEQFKQLAHANYGDRIQTKSILKDSIEIHQHMRQLRKLHIVRVRGSYAIAKSVTVSLNALFRRDLLYFQGHGMKNG